MDQSPECPLVSLLVPIYNVEEYLRECLESARKQTLKDIEIICINDGSTDSSPEILREFAEQDHRFRVIDKPNSGYGASMNRGLDAARGEFIAILESDDYLDEDALEVLYDAACKYDVDVVKADFYFFWSKPEVRNERFGWVTKETAGITNPQTDDHVYYLKPSIWSALYRRSFLEKNNIRFLETPGASFQDASFNFKVWASCDKVVLLDRAFVHYRQDNENSSVNSSGKTYCVCDEYDEMWRYIDAHPEKRDWLIPIIVKMRHEIYFWNYFRLAEECQREFVRRMSHDFNVEDEAGIVNYDLFDPWQIEERTQVRERPDLFHVQRTHHAKPGKLNIARLYFRTGGFPLLWELVKLKLKR